MAPSVEERQTMSYDENFPLTAFDHNPSEYKFSLSEILIYEEWKQ